jgi:hypothetical protein
MYDVVGVRDMGTEAASERSLKRTSVFCVERLNMLRMITFRFVGTCIWRVDISCEKWRSFHK